MITLMKLDLRILSLAAVLVLPGCASTLDQDDALAIAPYRILEDGRIVVETRVDIRDPFRLRWTRVRVSRSSSTSFVTNSNLSSFPSNR